MRRFAWFCLAASLFIFAAACSGPSGDLRGATPVGYLRSVVIPLADETTEPVTIAELLETPEDYAGQLIEVSGTYYQRQVVVCSTRPQYSPARWALSDGELRIPAGGLDQRLEGLPSGRIEIAAVGRWLQWQGPVGCGRQAQVTEVWYLDVEQVVSPNPITIAAVGSDEGEVAVQSEPTEDTSGGYPGPEGTAESDEPQISATEIVSGTDFPGLPEPVGTPVLQQPTPSPTTSGGANATATPTIANGGGIATPTVTSSAATATPTTTGGSPTPTATSTDGSGGEPVTVDQEDLPPGSIETAELGVNEIHRWPLVITSTAVITINVASEIDLDIEITILDPSGAVVAQQNNAQGGSPEVLAAVPLSELGTYDILITSENDETGFYAILALDVLDDDYYTFVFNDTLEVGQSETTTARPNNDHFWFFFGTAGETVTIRVSPTDISDLFIRLFGPNDSLLVDFHNETGEGEVEELLSFTLPDTGFYSLLLGELNFGASTYTISLISG
jgi:hypothetical protein